MCCRCCCCCCCCCFCYVCPVFSFFFFRRYTHSIFIYFNEKNACHPINCTSHRWILIICLKSLIFRTNSSSEKVRTLDRRIFFSYHSKLLRKIIFFFYVKTSHFFFSHTRKLNNFEVYEKISLIKHNFLMMIFFFSLILWIDVRSNIWPSCGCVCVYVHLNLEGKTHFLLFTLLNS